MKQSKLNLKKLTTESRNPRTRNLDRMSALEICTAMNREDSKIIKAVRLVLPEVAKAVDAAAAALAKGGRIIYVGAGTSGRIGLMDAVECPPTFGVSPATVVGLMAGGSNAFTKAKEGAEDSAELGENDLRSIRCTSKDFVIGLAASGRTPYVIGALQYAGKKHAHTAAIACNRNSEIGRCAEIVIEPVCGPEVLTGSTRLKSGTAQKMIANMISTGAMVLSGKAYENLMVDVKPTNEKLVARAQNIIREATGCSPETAAQMFMESGGSVKTAIVMITLGCTKRQAEFKLRKAAGHIRRTMELG